MKLNMVSFVSLLDCQLQYYKIFINFFFMNFNHKVDYFLDCVIEMRKMYSENKMNIGTILAGLLSEFTNPVSNL